ncbi:MAG: hypothetical protein IKI82_05930, partial [Lachnospiraceae bacterium]|nr:hypothetical protein [Lachnospiraceae bacterium]
IRALRSKKGAVLSMAVGTLVMTVFGSLFNAWFLLPKFAELYGIPMDVIISMGTKVNSAIVDVRTLVAFAVVPFNLLKGVVAGHGIAGLFGQDAHRIDRKLIGGRGAQAGKDLIRCHLFFDFRIQIFAFRRQAHSQRQGKAHNGVRAESL